MKKMNQPIVLIFILIVASSIFACSFFTNLGQPDIPVSAQAGLKPGTSKILGYFQLNDWAQGVSSNANLTIFEAQSAETGQNEIRVFLKDGQSTQYIGVLSNQLDLPDVYTLFVDFGGQRCIVGWVSPDTQGQLLSFRIERPETDKKSWMEAVKESTIEKNLFIVPIKSSDQPNLWDVILMTGVQTKESLKRGFDGNGSYYQIEKTYSPPLDVSSFYIPISIQK